MFAEKNKGGPAGARPPKYASAAEATQLAKELPDRLAIKETHFVDLLKYLSREDNMNCNRFVIFLQPTNDSRQPCKETAMSAERENGTEEFSRCLLPDTAINTNLTDSLAEKFQV